MNLYISLSERSVDDAIAQLKGYLESLEAKTDALCARVAEECADAARANVPVDTGWLLSGISVEKRGDADYEVVSEGEYAAFVEFGTGVVGQGTYPGELPAGYGYDERRTPEAHDPLDPEAWYYYDRYGERRRTKGHKAQPYMLDSAEYARASVMDAAREVFG